MGLKMLVYDIEIRKAVPKRDEERVDGIEYCKGWRDYGDMGVSVVCAMEWEVGSPVLPRPPAFYADNMAELFKAAMLADCIAGFNSKRFDDQVLEASDWLHAPDGVNDGYQIATDYDLLAECWIADGLDPDRFYPQTHGGFGLDALAKANGLGGKTGHGATAPIDWQKGRYGALTDYCLADVWLTASLIQKAIDCDGMLAHPKHPFEEEKMLKVALPTKRQDHGRGTPPTTRE